MVNLREAIDDVIRREGDRYTNDPNDSGGPTRWGITQATLSEYRGRACSARDVASLTEKEAREIYEWRYWKDPGFDKVAFYSNKVAEELLDTGVNAGTARAVMILQRALNGLNNQGKHYSDVSEDGQLGPKTLEALRRYIQTRGQNEGITVLLRYLNGLQVALYDDIARRRPKDESFMYGWLLNRVS